MPSPSFRRHGNWYTWFLYAVFLQRKLRLDRRRLFLWSAPLILGIVAFASFDRTRIERFQEPVDALSVRFLDERENLEVSALVGNRWTAWESLTIEDEQDPLLRESNLVMFPSAVSTIRFRGNSTYAVHPIRISREPTRYQVAARGNVPTPRILKRSDWGADESLLIETKDKTPLNESPEVIGDNGTAAPSNRVKDCEDLHTNYPHEFKVERTMQKNAHGETLRWPQEYSPSVRVLVVHHTALKIDGDERHPVERVRALYQYHAENRGWGDVGYHYLIDELGQMYEGRAGGRGVIGGHVYCNNVGTVGVALLGNFELEQPTQDQVKSLQWLLADLGKEYDINLRKNVVFRGTSISPIVGHRQLVSTECPGYYLSETLDQIRRNVTSGNLSAGVSFPILKRNDENKMQARKLKRTATAKKNRTEGLFAVGSENMLGRPGGEILFTMKYRAGTKSVKKRANIGKVVKSRSELGVWQEINGNFIRLRENVDAPENIPAGGEAMIRIKVLLPMEAGTTTLMLGDVSYVFKTEGRRTRSPIGEPSRQSSLTSPKRVAIAPRAASIPQPLPPEEEGESRTINKQNKTKHSPPPSEEGLGVEASIRIRLTTQEKNIQSCVDSRIENIRSQYRGTLECQILDGSPALINELPLEDYLAGLAEEPDTEPYEKQRAFAIAARTYAAYYMDEDHPRKFPGLPYDGSDNPAIFQAYGGISFEKKNPRWVKAVKSTTGQVLTKNGQIIRAPYFSTDDGRTRTPAEAGWKDFPFPEIFTSKEDPWCRGMQLWGHGVGMSGCGSGAQAREGKTAEEILRYYYPGTEIK